MKQQIVSRWDSSRILFECEVPDYVESGLAMRHALERAVAQRPRIDLRGADLSDADGQPLPRATPEQAIENLDKVRAIVLDDQARLEMGHWHGDDEWRGRTCAEEAVCGTTHCMAGWLQVCTTEPALKEVEAHTAGVCAAPIAAKMFFRGQKEALEWLTDRKYVAETEEAERRAAARKAKREAAQG